MFAFSELILREAENQHINIVKCVKWCCVSEKVHLFTLSLPKGSILVP